MLMTKQLFLSILLFLFSVTSLAYAGTIAVNSPEDTNLRDDAVTLREAILMSEGDLAYGALTSAEQSRVSPPIGSAIADTINFDISGIIIVRQRLLGLNPVLITEFRV